MADAPQRDPSRSANADEPTIRLGPVAPPSSQEPYRPLSGLALAGFFFSAVYALIVFGGGVLSFVDGRPWILPGWVHVLCVAGLALCWVARTRIQEAEGVLSGAALAKWGIGLCGLFALLYASYYTATYFAIRDQASKFADSFFGYIKKGDLAPAFVLTIRPPRADETAADLRDRVENLYNAAGPSHTPGDFTKFGQVDYVRTIGMGGADAELKLQGVREWYYKEGGYRVHLVYRLTTPIESRDMMLTVQGNENPREYAGRKWHVVREDTGLLEKGHREVTAAGAALIQLADRAVSFGKEWLDALEGGERQGTYLDTLPPAQRASQILLARTGEKWTLAAQGAGATAMAIAPPANRAFAYGHGRFLEGAVLKADPKSFWCPASLRPQVLELAERCFRMPSAGERHPAFGLVRTSYPVWEKDGDRIRFRFDVVIKAPDQMLDGELHVVGNESEVQDRRARNWQVEKLELIRARTVPKAVGPPGPGGL